MGLVVTPVLKGKEEEWKNWAKNLNGEIKKDFDEMNKRYGLNRHDVWAVETPNGLMAVVLHEGPGGDTFMQKIGTSNHPFDVKMREKIGSFHGIKFDGPPPGPMPVKLV